MGRIGASRSGLLAQALRRLRDRAAFLHDPGVDRYLLEHALFPALLADPGVQRVLFVGCEWYTRRYPQRFAGRSFVTIDVDPAKARYGGRPHLVASFADVDHHVAAGSLDAVVANGVIGFGLDDPADCERALAASFRCLRPGGWLVIGWNDVDDLRPVRLGELDSLRAYEHVPLPPFPTADHPTFSPARHVFSFYRRPFDHAADPGASPESEESTA
jgi:SAM-dependent methyltransferase